MKGLCMKYRRRFFKLFAGVAGVMMAVAAGWAATEQAELAWTAAREGRHEEAYALFSAQFRKDPGNISINLGLGESALELKRYSHALFAFERVLMAEPDHQRATYGLARALQALGRSEEAQAEFARLLKMELPSEVRQAVRAQAEGLRPAAGRFRLKGRIQAGLVYDDNVNTGPDSRPVGGVFGVVASTKPDDAWGAELQAAVNGVYDVGGKGGWFALGGARLYTTVYDASPNQETLYYRVYAGARRLQGNSLLDLTVRHDELDYGHDELLRSDGVDLLWIKALSARDHWSTRVSLDERDYLDGSDRDSTYLMVQQIWRHYFENRKNQLFGSVALFNEAADEAIHRNRGGLLQAGGEYAVAERLTGYASLRMRHADYSKRQPAFTNRRTDTQWEWIWGLRRSLSELLSLDLRHRYVFNESNVGLYEYKRNVLTLAVSADF